ncbi:MAG: FAD-dependent oxidoreductase, partial [Fidelibacterota bacterium]
MSRHVYWHVNRKRLLIRGNMVHLSIDNKQITVPAGTTILKAARSAEIYIPVLCSHPDLPPFHSVKLSDFVFQGTKKITNDPGKTIDSVKECGICIVQQEGVELPLPSCETEVKDGMKIYTDTDLIRKKRQQNLMRYLTNHPHACLTCSQREGCIPFTDVCPSNVPLEERCCALLGMCEIQKVAEYVGIAPETPRYRPQTPGLLKIVDDPLFIRDYNLCISCGRCVRVCQSVKGVDALGAVINDGELIVGTVNGSLLKDAECRFCGVCVEVCPTGAIQDKTKPRLKDESELVPCKAGCPGEVDIPLYVQLIEEGKYQEAGGVLVSKLPLAAVLGKVCFQPCEIVCRRGELAQGLLDKKQSVSIRLLKDFAMSRYTPPSSIKTASRTGKNVAVIGSGPAGLTAAYFLALKGHEVTIYESKSEIGGMLRYGIPRYRLPQEILEKDLYQILKTGVKINTNTTLGKEVTLEALLKKPTDAVFLAVGLSKGKRLPVPGADLDGIFNGINFLHQVSQNTLPPDYFKLKNVVVIGGGNVAIDAARSAIRLQAKNVTVICLESPDEMPAYPSEIATAKQENVYFMNEWGIERIAFVQNDPYLYDVVLKKCTSVFNEQGKFAPMFDESIKNNISADSVLICIGQEADTNFIEDGLNLSFSERGTIGVDETTLETNITGVFAGGDVVSGPASVIDAVAAGRKAARSIDRFLGGDGSIEQDQSHLMEFMEDKMFVGREQGFAYLPRASVPLINVKRRKLNFDPVEQSFSEEVARAEAHRCLKCRVRLYFQPNPLPPEKVLIFGIKAIEAAPETEGVIQLLDDKKEVITIKGCDNIKNTLLELLENGSQASYFTYELEPMYTRRESELIQQYLQKYGRLPTEGE